MDCIYTTCHNIPREYPYFAGYIDPGTGYIFSSYIPTALGLISAFFAGVARVVSKKRGLYGVVLIAILLLIITIESVSHKSKSKHLSGRKIVILGIDGMDPNIVQEEMDKGALPHLSALKKQGFYSPLETTIPPQSPVAWASFATGTGPEKHGLYDFIIRNPKNYQLDLVWTDTVSSPIHTQSFWQKTENQALETTVLFLPNTFPPHALNGRMISGMGVPDIGGTAGKFSFFTTKYTHKKSRGNQIPLNKNRVQTVSIPGPRYKSLTGKTAISHVPLLISKIEGKKQVALSLQNKKIIMDEKTFSDWIPIEFTIDLFTKIQGMGRFYLKQGDEDIELYLSPLNFNPDHPLKNISYPPSYSGDLAKNHGLFYTQGLPHDTWALEENALDDTAFLQQAEMIVDERERIYLGELKKQKSGLIVNYVGVIDTISHMYWKRRDIINIYYKKIDELIGKTKEHLQADDVLIVLSDHGFAGFDWEFNLNTWLYKKGYLVFMNDVTNSGELLEGVDWTKTRAYAIGYNGIYLNLKGREGKGIVEEKDAIKLKELMKKELLAVINPQTHTSVIKNIYTKEELKIKNDDTRSPDLFVGYSQGIRASWETAVGATPENMINRRVGKWSGDHLFDATEVPGVLFSNHNLKIKNPHIKDIMPLVMKLFQQ